MKRRVILARLTDQEAAAARALIERMGAKKAAKALGLCDVQTLYKATAQVGVSQLTANVVRSRLSSRMI